MEADRFIATSDPSELGSLEGYFDHSESSNSDLNQYLRLLGLDGTTGWFAFLNLMIKLVQLTLLIHVVF